MNSAIKALIALAIVTAPVGAPAAPGPIIQTRAGRIEGVTRNGIQVFKGIPFAAPPVGRLRWRAPQPVKAWKGILVATHYKPACMQKGMYPPEAPPEQVSEDCLYLNVRKPATTGSAPLPVMVWIYGGSLENGSAAVPLYSGDKLARHGVIVVTANYRLGVFGYLALPRLTAESPHHRSGDYGLLDQLAALRWVHRNIAAFGGNPHNVTVFGQSSGSISVSALTASPLAKSLFQRAIGESGGLFEPITLLPQFTLPGAEAQGKRFMARAGATSLAVLRRMPAKKLLTVPFAPRLIVDGYVVPRPPWKTYMQGKANKVSLLIGWNENDGALFVAHYKLTPSNYRHFLEQSFPSSLVRLLAPSPGTSDASARAAAIAFNTDMRFRWDMWTWARLAADKEGDRVYLYEFARTPPYPTNSRYHGLGATHGLEMPYVFDHLTPHIALWTAADYRLARVMSAYWTRFAKSGNPNDSRLPTWPAFDLHRERFMYLGKRIRSEPMSNMAPLHHISRVYKTLLKQAQRASSGGA